MIEGGGGGGGGGMTSEISTSLDSDSKADSIVIFLIGLSIPIVGQF